MTQARNYIWQVLLLALALLSGTALLNYISDPYGIYNAFCRVGGNAEKPGQKGHDRLVKAYALREQKPDVVLLGTSRVQYGLNPNDEALKSLGKHPYNGALLGSNIYLLLRYLQHAEALSHVRLAVIGLDPMMFDDGMGNAQGDFSEARLAVDAKGTPQPFGPWTDVPSTLLSWDTTRLSLRTWRKQASIVSDLTQGGQRSPMALQRLYNDGSSMMERFLGVDAQYAKDYHKTVWPKDEATSPSLQAFAALLEFALRHDIRLELYLTPEHVHLHEVARLTGHDTDVQNLTNTLVAMVEGAQARAALPQAVTLWDFSGLNSLTTEAVPQSADGASTTMEWFWEPTHTKDTFGHLLLARMFQAEMDNLTATLGQPITSHNATSIAQEKAAALTRWRTSHIDEAQAIAKKIVP